MTMEKVADQRHMTLRLHPEDIETVNIFQEGMLTGDEISSVLAVEADNPILHRKY